MCLAVLREDRRCRCLNGQRAVRSGRERRAVPGGAQSRCYRASVTTSFSGASRCAAFRRSGRGRGGDARFWVVAKKIGQRRERATGTGGAGRCFAPSHRLARHGGNEMLEVAL